MTTSSTASGAAIAAVIVLLVAGTAMAQSPAVSEVARKSGYALGSDRCGQPPNEFPKLRIGMRDGYCAGLVASKEDGLVFPRSIVQIPGRNQFVIADMGSWNPGAGRLLLLQPGEPVGHRLKELIVKLDFPFGLAVGPDDKIYGSTSETVFRFDPLASDPRATMETVVQRLPGQQITLSDGSRIEDSAHPLKPFVFDKSGRLYVSIGAPTDNCVSRAPITKPCAAGEGTGPLAAIWAFTPPPGGIFPALKASEPNPPREIFARGLRNSMALAVHPDYPSDGFAFLQGENARDLPDPLKPNEELNAIGKGKHYGWPYCYDLSTTSPEFKSFLQTSSQFRNFCNSAAYQQPYSLLPPHGAPLGMFYYRGEKFPELARKLVVGLHGYRPTGSRVIVYDVDDKGFPKISAPPVRYGVSCAAEPTRAFQTDTNPQVAAADFFELIAEWHKVNGVRPQGAPVGMTVASDGAIWLVEDKNQTIIRIDSAPTQPRDSLPCGARSEQQINELIGYVENDRANRTRLTQIRSQLIERRCAACHSDFGIQPGQTEAQKDIAVLRFLLSQDGWIFPGNPEAGKLHARLRGLGAESIMPPNGKELLASEQGYKPLIDSVDRFAGSMVPGQRKRVRPGRVERRFYDRKNKECGVIPTGSVVVVVDRRPTEKPNFSRIYRPADLYLNGECADEGGYYLEQNNLAPL